MGRMAMIGLGSRTMDAALTRLWVVASSSTKQSPGPGPTCLPQEVNTHHEHDSNSGDHAHQRGRHGVGPQIGGGDHIDQIGRAGKVCAGKGKATAGNRAGQQIAGQVGLLEQGEGNGIQAEHHHQSGDTAIDQHCAGENDAQDGKLLPNSSAKNLAMEAAAPVSSMTFRTGR